MPKEEWGVKRLCAACGVRFYDLGRDPVDCPKCGETYVPVTTSVVKSRVTKAPVKKVVKDDDDDDDDVIDDDDDDDVPPIVASDDDDDDDKTPVADDDDDDDEEEEEDVLLADDDEEDDDDLGEIAGVDIKKKDI